MWLFKKKEKIDSKFSLGERVRFKHNNDLTIGYIYKIYLVENKVCYDIQIGGECPVVITHIFENQIIEYK